jgi:uncharacterized membrane protein YcaP (DUF421 family)
MLGGEEFFMLISLIRAVILYLALILVVRLMGKRQLGEMEPMEFVVTMLIANLAAVPMQETGTPLLVVLSVELVLSVLTYRSVGMRRFLCGKPVILIENGRLLQQNLKKTRVNTDELAEYLRIQGVTDLSQVQYAILETSGAISTFLYPKYEPAPAKDAGVQVGARKLPITVIASGRLMRQNLTLLGRDEAWVQEILKNYNCRVQDVYLLTSEPDGKLYFAAMREDET